MKPHQRLALTTGAIVFVTNMTENIIHYSYGKQNGSDDKSFKFHFPENHELLKMIGTSIIAGYLVGTLTKYIK